MHDDDGTIRLMAAFWSLVRDDLAGGDRRTREWLNSPNFEHWAILSFTTITPEEVRSALLDVWPHKGMRFA